MNFTERIRERAAALSRTIVFPEGDDARILEACERLARNGIAKPLLVLRNASDRPGEFASHIEWVPCHDGTPLECGARLVASGRADAMVAGATHTTADVVRTALRLIGTAPGVRTASSAFYMVATQPWDAPSPVLTFADCAVVPYPTPEQLADVTISAARDRLAVVGDEPRVALLSFSTAGSAAGASIDIVRTALQLVRDREPSLLADGEMQGDAALAASVAERKMPGSNVAGRANVLVFPSLDAGNIAYKLVQRLANAHAIGPVLHGFAKPVSDLSRGAEVEDIINVAAITALQSVNPRREA